MNPEEALIRAFVVRERRTRLIEALANPRRRRKALDSLNHFRHFDVRYAQLVPPAAHSPEQIAAILKAKGAPALCHLISDNTDLDGKDMPLADALARVVGIGLGTFISCVPGILGYFEGEEAGERYVLERRAV